MTALSPTQRDLVQSQEYAIEQALSPLGLGFERSMEVYRETEGWLFAIRQGLIARRAAERRASREARRVLRALRSQERSAA
jgi:hypothetical protein